ncbi:hypothetical protein RF11_00852 [Thelohanellus kitauei]|uniref:Uncharacterized protein n=1 Tax=Thelohanellus kitauei TaxID=669202 RepID=A0A0C2ML30_THEKT|nr:hypothetical protein RF11_00852 [Thelohanellus kitauei]
MYQNNQETVVKALESDRKFKFGKRACFVSPISLGSTRPTKFKGDINQKLCLYVSKIHPEVKEDELVGIFNQESVKKALLKTDGASIRDKTISVHISNPPKIAEKETKRTVVQMDNHEQTRITSQSYSNQDFQKLFKKN